MQKGMNRRDFMKVVGLGCGAVAVMSPIGLTSAIAEETYTGVTYLTPAYKALMWGVNGFNERLQKNAGDMFKISFYDSGTLMKADEQVAALRAGTIQYMFHTASYITRTFKGLGITGLPSLVEDLYEHGERLAIDTPLWKHLNERLAQDDIFMLSSGGGVLEPEYIWTGDNKIASLADLKGKRLRIVSYEATEALKGFGVAGVRIPSSEAYLALQRGTVDGMIGNISTIVGRKLNEQLKYCYELPVTGFTIGIYMLKSKWDQLDEKTKAAFWDAAKWFDENYAKTINGKFYMDEYWPMLKQGGMEVIKPTADELKQFADASKPVWEWWKKEVGEEWGQKAIDLALGKA